MPSRDGTVAPPMRAWAEALVEQARTDAVELTGDGGLLTALVGRVLQTGLDVELTDNLGHERHAVEHSIRRLWVGPGGSMDIAEGR